MTRYEIVTGSVTKALKGRDILRKNGIKTNVERLAENDKKSGCGYALIVDGNVEKAEMLLQKNGVRVLGINQRA